MIDELVPVEDAEFNEQRLEELAGRFATVRVFLPPMMRTVDSGPVARRCGGAGGDGDLGLAVDDEVEDCPRSWLDARQGRPRSHRRRAGSASSTGKGDRRRRWTGPPTRCACSSSSIGISSTATSSPRIPRGGVTRAPNCCREGVGAGP